MTPLSNSQNSFLLRIWRDTSRPDTKRDQSWRAWIQHVRSGETIYAEDLSSLLHFIERWTGTLGPPSESPNDH